MCVHVMLGSEGGREIERKRVSKNSIHCGTFLKERVTSKKRGRGMKSRTHLADLIHAHARTHAHIALMLGLTIFIYFSSSSSSSSSSFLFVIFVILCESVYMYYICLARLCYLFDIFLIINLQNKNI